MSSHLPQLLSWKLAGQTDVLALEQNGNGFMLFSVVDKSLS